LELRTSSRSNASTRIVFSPPWSATVSWKVALSPLRGTTRVGPPFTLTCARARPKGSAAESVTRAESDATAVPAAGSSRRMRGPAAFWRRRRVVLLPRFPAASYACTTMVFTPSSIHRVKE
jgi:hypothetical protein